VKYAWNLPWEIKASGGEMKGVLRRALKGILPPEILSPPKWLPDSRIKLQLE
jgi:asparagine synthase (glutamine-hydrolysing)